MSKVTVDVYCVCGASEDWGKYMPVHGERSNLWTDNRGNEGSVKSLIDTWFGQHQHDSDQPRIVKPRTHTGDSNAKQ